MSAGMTQCPTCFLQASPVEAPGPGDHRYRCSRCGWELIVDGRIVFRGRDALEQYLAWINEQPSDEEIAAMDGAMNDPD